MKYLILFAALFFGNIAFAKTPGQFLGTLEVQQIIPIQEAHNLVLKQIQGRVISEKAGALKIRDLLTQLTNLQSERMKKARVRGLMLQQLQAYYQDLSAVMKSEIDVFEGRLSKSELKAPVAKFIATTNIYKQLLNENSEDIIRRLAYNSAQLEDTIYKAYLLALQGKMKKEEVLDMLQRQFPEAFTEIGKEQESILSQTKDAADRIALKDMIQISRLNAMVSWKYGNALRTGNKSSADEAEALVKQRHALIAKIKAESSAPRQPASH